MTGERGSISLVVAAAVAAAAILGALSADLGVAATARTRAQTAADAAALAAAQELVAPSRSSPQEVASEFARRHGAAVTRCRCDPAADEVTVWVELPVVLPFVGVRHEVEAAARAVVDLHEMLGLQPEFASRLRCLFAHVSGLSLVSGFRTRAEQAALYEQKPHLAAPPGHSMHELGLAADLGFASEAARTQAHRMARTCGLVFPVSYEPWHVEPGTTGPPSGP